MRLALVMYGYQQFEEEEEKKETYKVQLEQKVEEKETLYKVQLVKKANEDERLCRVQLVQKAKEVERLCRVQLVQRTKKGMLYRVQLIKKDKETEYSWFRGSRRRKHCTEFSWFRGLKTRRLFTDCNRTVRRSGFGALVGSHLFEIAFKLFLECFDVDHSNHCRRTSLLHCVSASQTLCLEGNFET